MDYGKVLERAWQITWRWKALWVLGFLVSLGSGWSSTSNYSTSSEDWSGSGWYMDPGAAVALIVAIMFAAVLFGIVIWVLSTIARGGLIAGERQVEDEGATSLGAAWRAGVGRFWTLFGIGILTGLPALILIVGGMVALTLLIIGTVAAFDAAAELGGTLGIVASVLCGGVLCCGGILVALVFGQIRIYAERAAVLEGLGWIDSVKRGWQVIRDNLGPTLVFWLIFFVIGLILGSLIFGGLAIVLLPLMGIVANTDPGAWLILPICCGGLLGLIVAGLIGSVVETFTSATWTLAYRRLTAQVVPASEVLPAE